MLNDLLEESGITDFSVMGNNLVIRNQFEPIGSDVINELNNANLNLSFLEGVYTKEELPTKTRFIEGDRAVFTAGKAYSLERIKCKYYIEIKGRGAKTSSLKVKNFIAERSSLLSQLTVRESDIKVNYSIIIKSSVIENSNIDTNNLVLKSVNLSSTSIGVAQLSICGKTKCDKIILHDAVSLVIQDDFKGVIELVNPLQFLFIDMRLKAEDSSDFKIIGHVDTLCVHTKDKEKDRRKEFEKFQGFSKLTWKRSFGGNGGDASRRARMIENNRTIEQ